METVQNDIDSYHPPSKEKSHFRQTFDDGRRRFSSKPLSQLEQMSISDLSVPWRHEGIWHSPSVISLLIPMSKANISFAVLSQGSNRWFLVCCECLDGRDGTARLLST